MRLRAFRNVGDGGGGGGSVTQGEGASEFLRLQCLILNSLVNY